MIRSAWRAFSSVLRCSASTSSTSVRRSRAPGHRVTVAFELGERQLALVECRLSLRDRLLGDLEPARVPVAAGAQVMERPVELLARAARSAVGAADRGLEAIAQRAVVARQVAQLEMVDRRCRAEEALGRDAGQLGHDLVGEGRVGDRLAVVVEPDGALRAGERLLERADLLAVVLVLLELEGDDRAGLRRRAPRPQRLELGGRARRPPRQGQLERALDGALARFVRAADDRQAGREVDVEGPVAPEVASVQPADPHSETSRPASSSRPSRSVSRASAASSAAPDVSSSAIRRLQVADERPGDRVGRGQRPVGQRRDRAVAQAHLEERAGQRRLHLERVEVQLVAADADQPDVEHQVRIGACGEERDERRLAVDRRRVDLGLLEPGPADLSIADRDHPLAGPLVELDEEHLAGAVLVQRDRLGRARVGVADPARLARLHRVPVTRARDSRARWRRSPRS